MKSDERYIMGLMLLVSTIIIFGGMCMVTVPSASDGGEEEINDAGLTMDASDAIINSDEDAEVTDAGVDSPDSPTEDVFAVAEQ